MRRSRGSPVQAVLLVAVLVALWLVPADWFPDWFFAGWFRKLVLATYALVLVWGGFKMWKLTREAKGIVEDIPHEPDELGEPDSTRRNPRSGLTEISPNDVGVAVVFGVAIVFSVVDRAWLIAAIIGLVGLGYFLFVSSTSKNMRAVNKLIGELPDAPQGEATEAMLAVDALDEAIHDAPGVPFTDQVRLDRRGVEDLLSRLRTALPPGASELIALLDELDQLIRRAKPIPLTAEIRLDREEVYDVLDRMRARLGEERLGVSGAGDLP